MTSRPTLLLSVLSIVACGGAGSGEGATEAHRADATTAPADARLVTVLDSTIAGSQAADGIAAPVQQAVLSTKLMGTVIEVLVREGDLVSAGQSLARIDARDVDAKGAQVAASVAAAEAQQANATVQLKRIRALFADSAAPKAMLDAAELGSAQADAALRAARAASAEVASIRDYAVLKAPFAGLVTKRFVDAGAFAAPGTPIVHVQDVSRLRLTVSAPPEAARAARRGAQIQGMVDGTPVTATVEGVVPSAAGGVWVINAIVENPTRVLATGGAATLYLPSAPRRALLVPSAAITTNGELTGVRVRVGTSDDLRWVRVGRQVGSYREILSGVRAGDQLLIPRRTP